MGKPRRLPLGKEGGIQIINFTTAISYFFPQTTVSVGNGSVVFRALALLDTEVF